MSGSKGAISYDIGASTKCIIPSQKIGTVETTSRHLFNQCTQPNYKKGKSKRILYLRTKFTTVASPRFRSYSGYVGSGLSNTKHLAQRSINGQEAVSPDSDIGRAIVELGESMTGLDSSNRTHVRHTLDLAVRIGCRPLIVLVDSESTGNYIDARE